MLILAGILPLLPGAGAGTVPAKGWKESEAAGDRWDGQARAHYQKALEAWSQVERYAARVDNRFSAGLARRARASLTLNLRDSSIFQSFAGRAEAQSAAPLPLSFPELAAAEGNYLPARPAEANRLPAEEDLKELARFLTQAGRSFFDLKEKEDQDLPLLFEALALSYRLLGDYYQARGDADYRQALAQAEAERKGGAAPETAAAAIRLRYKLRDFAGAYQTFLAANLKDQELRGKDRVSYLQLARDLARFRGDSEQVVAINKQLIALDAKAEEQPPPLVTFPSFVTGRALELARLGRILVDAAAALSLSARERAVATWIGGAAVLEAGQPALANEILLKVKSEEAGEPWLKAKVAVTVAEARERMGDYEGALSAYNQARALLGGLSSLKSIPARITLNAASIFLRLGELAPARDLAFEVLEKRDLPADLPIRARILLGDCRYFDASDTDEAERQLLEDALQTYQLAERELEAKRLADSKTAAELRAQTSIHIGNTRRRLALLKAPEAANEADRLRREAVQAQESARRTALESKLDKLAAVAAANLGELHLELGELDSARQFTQSALEKARELSSFECEWRAHWYLGRIADAGGDLAAAEREYQQAAAIIESFRQQMLGPQLKSGFMTTKKSFFEMWLRRSLQRGDARAAFLAAERARARAFVESLGLRFLLLATDQDRQLYREYINLLSRLEAREEKGSPVLAQFKRFPESYEELRRQLQELLNTIRTSPAVSPLVRALVEGSPSDAPQVQRALRPGEVLIEFASSGDSLVAFVLSSKDFQAVDLRAPPRPVSRWVKAFLEKSAGDDALAEKLYQTLIAPVAGAAEALSGGGGAPQVTIVPWGPLFRLPFESLKSGKSYLVERWQIAYLPSASVLKYITRESPGAASPGRLVAFVDPDTDYDGDGKPDYPRLKFAHEEVAGIAPLFREKVILEGAAALEEVYPRLAPQGEVFHLACHGEFFPARPLDSSLYLTKSQLADGRLQAAEIFAIDFRGSRLITLSGCETGRLEVNTGDDPVGIGTSLLHSGARALLASLWKVEDQATADLMLNFYRSWLGEGGQGHGSRAQALRQAKLKMLREGKFTAPRQWAAFILIGVN